MIETTETPEDVEKLLVEARAKLQAFEDGVDRARLLKRLKTQSPAHPVLLFRALFLFLCVLSLIAAVTVMIIPLVNTDLARALAKFDAVVPAPAGVPALPALMGVLALCMIVGWIMTTFAAYAMGRDAQMLPWEQKQHQKLVNEVTRLTTQKAVMERIRGTPAGARPRIATPVPVSLRDRGGIATPPGLGRSGGSALGGGRGPRPGGFGPPPGDGGSGPIGGGTPPGAGRSGWSPPAKPGGVLARARSGGPGPDDGGGTRGGIGRPPSHTRPSGAGGGGGMTGGSNALGVKPTGFGPPGGDKGGGSGLGGSSGGLGGGGAPGGAAGGGGLGTAPGGFRGASMGGGASSSAEPAATESGGLRISLRPPDAGTSDLVAGGPGASTRGGTPLGAAPRAGRGLGAPANDGPRLAAPLGFPGTPESAERGGQAKQSNIFGTPAGMSPRKPLAYGSPDAPQPGAGLRVGSARPSAAVDAGPADPLPDIVDNAPPSYAATPAPSSGGEGLGPQQFQARAAATTSLPKWGRIEEPWLEEAIEKAENIARGFPVHAHLEFSQETYLPFSLVIARATPAMAFRAMVTYVEFLASILTPPRARIELNNVAHLDRSFHRNVTAALEPYFGDKFTVEPEPGRVEITFTEPDPSWQDYPVLPML